jgi:hypothetical protein
MGVKVQFGGPGQLHALAALVSVSRRVSEHNSCPCFPGIEPRPRQLYTRVSGRRNGYYVTIDGNYLFIIHSTLISKLHFHFKCGVYNSASLVCSVVPENSGFLLNSASVCR